MLPRTCVLGAATALVAAVGFSCTCVSAQPEPNAGMCTVHVSWGHRSVAGTKFALSFRASDLVLGGTKGEDLENGDIVSASGVSSVAGGGDVDGVELPLHFEPRTIQPITNLHSIWRYLFEHSDAETAARLRQDAAFRPDSRKLTTVVIDRTGTRGFSLTVDQLLTQKAFWVRDLDVFLTLGEQSFQEHLQALSGRKMPRIRERTEAEPEASYAQFAAAWEDMGSPGYRNPNAPPPGHIVGLTWDSAIHKFGIERGAGVRSDYGNPDKFRFGFNFGDLGTLNTNAWKGQQLDNGLPIIKTTIDEAGIRYEVEQFAYPLEGPPKDRQGEMDMVLLQKLRVTNLHSGATNILVGLHHERKLNSPLDVKVGAGSREYLLLDNAGGCCLALEGDGISVRSGASSGPGTNDLQVQVALAGNGSREFVVKLPSPVLVADKVARLTKLDYGATRRQTVAFWNHWLEAGAKFQVPEEAVNQLFRANLWHALRLPRRHGASPGAEMDLPYSNFAYDQKGIPWPVNQSVYVDYMLYDLRGYHSVSAEELEAMFRGNQEPNGHIKGFANWGVYTPGMLYSVAKHFLLSGDRESFERLLPQALRSLDWCLEQVRGAAERSGPGQGLVLRPLNDLSHEDRAWAFNQAYLFAGLDLFSKALEQIRHPRASETAAAARAIHKAIRNEFTRASVESPLVQLRDGSWSPYVPSDATFPGRRLQTWYPTDIDTGPLHLSRLEALDPAGPLTDYLLNDHEDNLFLGQLSMANEPVYNQHATAYLLRDEVKPAIRAFYSMMACAFSHSVFEPVEHRWAWGQYFGPPSTDGAWFELYRNMLVREMDDDTLLLLQAAPRKWWDPGKKMIIERAPTYFGELSLETRSPNGGRTLECKVKMPERRKAAALLVRFRDPKGRRIASASVNGKPWSDFDPAKEWVRISLPNASNYVVVVTY